MDLGIMSSERLSSHEKATQGFLPMRPTVRNSVPYAHRQVCDIDSFWPPTSEQSSMAEEMATPPQKGMASSMSTPRPSHYLDWYPQPSSHQSSIAGDRTASENYERQISARTSVSRMTQYGVHEVPIDEIKSDSEESMDEGEFLFTDRAEDIAKASTMRKEMLSQATACRCLVTSVVGLNTLVIAGEAMFISEKFVAFDLLEICFTVFYVLEVSFRLYEVGWLAFVTQLDWAWNVFDMVITFASVVDTVTSMTTGSASGASVGRLFRLFRILRMFRAMRFMHEVDYVLGIATKATMKLGVIVSLFIFVTAIIATNMLWDSQDELVSTSFANLGISMWTMFKLMTLDDWVPISERVIAEKPGMLVFFVVFIFSTSIALISLVPAIFIEISLNSPKFHAEKEKELLKRKKTKLLRTLFKLTDFDNNGNISVHEMKKVLTDDSLLRQLQRAGLTEAGELRDVRLGLFDLWEEQLEETNNTNSEISEEDFIQGVLRSYTDVSQATVWRSSMATRLMLRDFASYVRTELKGIRSHDLDKTVSIIRETIDATKDELARLYKDELVKMRPPGDQAEGDVSGKGASEEVDLDKELSQLSQRKSSESLDTEDGASDGFVSSVADNPGNTFQRRMSPVCGLAFGIGLEGRFKNSLLQMSPQPSPRMSSETPKQNANLSEGSGTRGRSTDARSQIPPQLDDKSDSGSEGQIYKRLASSDSNYRVLSSGSDRRQYSKDASIMTPSFFESFGNQVSDSPRPSKCFPAHSSSGPHEHNAGE